MYPARMTSSFFFKALHFIHWVRQNKTKNKVKRAILEPFMPFCVLGTGFKC